MSGASEGSAPAAIRLVYSEEELVKIVVVLQPVGAAKALAEHGQIAFGQEADSNDRVYARLGNGLMI